MQKRIMLPGCNRSPSTLPGNLFYTLHVFFPLSVHRSRSTSNLTLPGRASYIHTFVICDARVREHRRRLRDENHNSKNTDEIDNLSDICRRLLYNGCLRTRTSFILVVGKTVSVLHNIARIRVEDSSG
jgi:hypothetical protein